jgi:hypothetical protein
MITYFAAAGVETYTCMSDYYFQTGKGQYKFSEAEKLNFGGFRFYKVDDFIIDQGGLLFKYKKDLNGSKLYLSHDNTGLLLSQVKDHSNKTSVINSKGTSYTTMDCLIIQDK